ncbi:SDR family oxidoreductase [Streptomyces pseudogriseolus]|uniref:SDR family oxidoreductase n=1 Tax=Streptomyces pseudogriseolus TaxID=36817 RepID=UPI003FA1F00E
MQVRDQLFIGHGSTLGLRARSRQGLSHPPVHGRRGGQVGCHRAEQRKGLPGNAAGFGLIHHDGATKAAVTQLTRNLRASLGPRGVRVRSVDPAFAVTELGAGMAHEATRAGLDETRSAITTISAEDVADALTYSVAVPARVNIAELTVVPTELG